MWRTLPLFLSLFLVAPGSARAQDEEEATEEEPKPKKKSKGDSAGSKSDSRFEDVELTPKRKKKSSDKPGTEKGAAAKPEQSATDKPELTQKPEEGRPPTGFPRHRYGYVIGGGFLVTGLAFAYSAQGEAKRAETIGSAREATAALENARASAATANVIYGAAAVTLAVALLFEIIPAPVAEKASLTFHF